MDPRTRVLLVDYAVAVGATALGLLGTPHRSVGVAALTLLGGLLLVGTLAVVEQTDALDLVDERRPTSLLVAAAVTFGVALALILGRLVVPWPSAPMLAGMGAGLAGYRTAFGLYRPLPPARLAHFRADRR